MTFLPYFLLLCVTILKDFIKLKSPKLKKGEVFKVMIVVKIN